MRWRRALQIFFAVLLNADFVTFLRSIVTGKAGVSKAFTKNICVPGLNCYSCPSALGACPIGSLQFYLNDLSQKLQLGEKINRVGLYLFGFFAGTGIIGGRIFCGWVCPFGLVQELINKITGTNKPVPKIATHGRYVTLAVFVVVLPLALYDLSLLSPWFCKLICPAGTLFAGLPLLLIDSSLRASASLLTLLKFGILVFIIVTLFFSNRFFCKTLCPLGAIWGLFNKISIFTIRYNTQICVQCNKCSLVCPMNLEVTREYESSRCIRCLQCTGVCPTGSLTFGTFYQRSSDHAKNNYDRDVDINPADRL